MILAQEIITKGELCTLNRDFGAFVFTSNNCRWHSLMDNLLFMRGQAQHHLCPIFEPSLSATALLLPKLQFSFGWFLHQTAFFVIELPWTANHQGDLLHLLEAFWPLVFKLIADFNLCNIYFSLQSLDECLFLIHFGTSDQPKLPEICKTNGWVFCHGVSQGNPSLCGAGGLLYDSESRSKI